MALPVALAVLTVGLVLVYLASGSSRGNSRAAVIFGLPVLVCYTFGDRPLRFGLGVAAVFLAALHPASTGR